MKVSQPTWLYPHQGKGGWKAGICHHLVLQYSWCGAKEISWVKAGKRKSSLTWACCRHWLWHDTILDLDMKCKAVSFTWGPNRTILSITIAKALQVKIDLRRIPKLPETWYFLPGGIGVPLSIACQCKTEAAVFTKLTNGPQVKHWAICETAFFLQALTSLLRLLAGECSVILSGLTYFNIMSFLIAFLEKICLQLHPVSLLRVLLMLTFSQGCICHS